MANHIFGLNDIPTVILVAATAAVGVVVARHQPSNPMGWLLLGTGGSMMMSVVGTVWLTLDYRIHHGQLPLGWLALLLQPGWAPAIVCLGLTVLLFPDGSLPSRRWRWLLWCYLAVVAAWVVGAWMISIAAIVTDHVRVDAGGELASLDYPAGGTAWWGGVQNAFLLLLGFSLLASIGRQAFAARLRDAVDLDEVWADLLSVVNRSLEPAHVSVWLAPGGATARGTPHGSRASTASS